MTLMQRSSAKLFRVACIVSHPIQYQVPLFRFISQNGNIGLSVFFLSDFSLRNHHEKAFGSTFKWDLDMVAGYDWQVLERWIGGRWADNPIWPVRGIRNRLVRESFDAIWVHGWAQVGLAQAIQIGRCLGIPILLRGETTPDQPPRRDLRRRIRNFYCRLLFQRVSGFLCIGRRNRDFYRSFGIPENRLFHVPYSVDNQFFQSRAFEASPSREQLRHRLGLEPRRPVILFVGKFISAKAPLDLVAAYRWLIERGLTGSESHVAGLKRRPYLLFAGDGPLREQLIRSAGSLLERDIRFLGFKNQSELPCLYDLCDVLALPSQFEPWGLVVNEVMNAGKPVIVSDRVGAGPDLVQPGVNGWVYPVGEVSELAGCIHAAFTDPDLEKMGKRSLEKIDSWDYRADLKGLLRALNYVRAQSSLRQGEKSTSAVG